MFEFLPSVIRTPLAFLIVLGVLVFVHEMGHYLAARWRGVHVEAFSIGFGKPIATWTDRVGTVWKLCWLPLGGYVKLHGQERPEDASPETRAAWIPGRTYHEKSPGSRAIVVAAGPVANFVLAAVLFTVLFAVYGRPVALPVVGEVLPDSAAAHGGLQTGDLVTAIGPQKIKEFQDIQHVVTASPGKALALHVLRDGKDTELTVTPESHDAGKGQVIGVLGIRGGGSQFEHLTPMQWIPAGIEQTWTVSTQTLEGVWQMLTARGSADDLGGPLRIAQMSGQVAELGFASLVSFIAVLSVNLGLINLFPIPVLDGGHLVFLLFEAVRGRPLPVRAQEYGFRAGFALLIGLFVFATWNDLAHIGLFRWVASLVG